MSMSFSDSKTHEFLPRVDKHPQQCHMKSHLNLQKEGIIRTAKCSITVKVAQRGLDIPVFGILLQLHQ